MSVDLKSFDRTHCFKRKLDQPEMVESCDHRRFWDQNQKLVLELTKNENDCSITCPEGKFLATYMKHTRSLHDVLGIMDDFINCDEYSYHPNMKIKRKFRSFVKSFKSQLYQFSCELIGDMKNGREDVVLLDNAEEPAIKLKKFTEREKDDFNSNIEVVHPDSAEESMMKLKRFTEKENDSLNSHSKEQVKSPGNEIDFNGSDIDLHLEEAMGEIAEIEKKMTTNVFGGKVSANNFSGKPSDLQNVADKNTFRHRGLNFEPDGFLTVYVDGSCLNNGRSEAQAGIGVWFSEGHSLNVSDRVKGPPTNNNAEIQAATLAVKRAKSIGVGKLRIHTDSQFLINCMTQWIKNWKRNNWMTASKKPVINKQSLMELDEVMSTMERVEWKYVPGHKGTIGNERADFLAKAGARK